VVPLSTVHESTEKTLTGKRQFLPGLDLSIIIVVMMMMMITIPSGRALLPFGQYQIIP